MAQLARIAWLYTRGPESVRIVETGPLQLAVHGPGRDRRAFTFATPQEMFFFNQGYANTLAAAGFRCAGFGIERRRGGDRRRTSRGSGDRRG